MQRSIRPRGRWAMLPTKEEAGEAKALLATFPRVTFTDLLGSRGKRSFTKPFACRCVMCDMTFAIIGMPISPLNPLTGGWENPTATHQIIEDTDKEMVRFTCPECTHSGGWDAEFCYD